jgi:hypothetical protein
VSGPSPGAGPGRQVSDYNLAYFPYFPILKKLPREEKGGIRFFLAGHPPVLPSIGFSNMIILLIE